MIEPLAISSEARRWLGVPYVHQGRTRFGVDCIGFVICVRDTVERWPQAMNEMRNYKRMPSNGLLLAKLTTYCTMLEAPEEGCVIAIQWPKTKEPSHVGIYSAGNILHAYLRSRAVIEHGFRAQWLRDAHSYWRLPGVATP